MQPQDTIPAIEQHPGFLGMIRHDYAAARHYNGSIVSRGGKLLYVWRREGWDGRSQIWRGELDPATLEVSQARCLLPGEDGHQYEDPRLCRFGKQLSLGVARVRVSASGFGPDCEQRFFGLAGKDVLVGIGFPEHKTNQVEKNWCQIETGSGDSLAVIYWPNPLQIRTSKGETFTAEESFSWPLNIHGGTPAIQTGPGCYLTLVHGSMPDNQRIRRYYLAALAFHWDGISAPTVTAVSEGPILWGSTNSPTILCPRDRHYLPVVVFPGGLTRHGTRLLATVGINDSYDALFDMTDHLSLIQPSALPDNAHILPQNRMLYPGQVAVRVVSRQPLGEFGGPYGPGDVFHTTPQRRQALGSLVEEVKP